MKGQTTISDSPRVGIGAAGDTPDWELIRHDRTLAGWFFIGQAEEAIFDVTLKKGGAK